jgi:beta-lactamase superfamily II metal-dependent hydrolase
MAKTAKSTAKVNSIIVRMYRAGTGDFFILKFKAGEKVTFKMMIDCGCISGGKETFTPLIEDLQEYTGGKIDLLVVTHEHADHINGFEKGKEMFKDIEFKKVWFAWTEDDTDDLANDLRKNNSKMRLALNKATAQLTQLKAEKYYEDLFKNEVRSLDKVKSQEYFIESISELNSLNFNHGLSATKTPTMEDLLREYNVITDSTEVEFLSPGDLKKNIAGATGIRFFVLGPPKDEAALAIEGKKGEGYEKRENKSTVDFSFVNALTDDINAGTNSIPFDDEYIEKGGSEIKKLYEAPDNKWRNISYDWLYNAGSLALRFERSINNTSLVLAMQFEDSERVLLFPGDAEYGNWESWHEGIEWTIKEDSKNKKINAEYLLNNTVFYKVGHHMSQNGSAKEHGIEMMVHEDLTAMATLDFAKINKLWMNTMPNDLIGAELIKRTKGKLFFVGNCENMIENISTDRVKIKKNDLATMRKLNKAFNGKKYIDYEVKG